MVLMLLHANLYFWGLRGLAFSCAVSREVLDGSAAPRGARNALHKHMAGCIWVQGAVATELQAQGPRFCLGVGEQGMVDQQPPLSWPEGAQHGALAAHAQRRKRRVGHSVLGSINLCSRVLRCTPSLYNPPGSDRTRLQRAACRGRRKRAGSQTPSSQPPGSRRRGPRRGRRGPAAAPRGASPHAGVDGVSIVLGVVGALHGVPQEAVAGVGLVVLFSNRRDALGLGVVGRAALAGGVAARGDAGDVGARLRGRRGGRGVRRRAGGRLAG